MAELRGRKERDEQISERAIREEDCGQDIYLGWCCSERKPPLRITRTAV